ncbi:Imm31 family immunity protein [Streptomyces litchfieldiae]|uniref:Imm31 family immunity protein n=1 Tax=Streptomyces litchfieldiae TaxID=3075543 RepID=A0ABU2MWL7_9ACTN|nr:Imm31 family immunity protein [Streptomyces sp. DSM 44938]MDT0346037.1 Imm31 family immunity protein [Streptomyces sp. DSM 44938]
MSDFDFYDVVDVLRTTCAAALGVGGARGVVLGISEGENGRMYAVFIGDTAYMLSPSDLVPTGERVDREAIYGGSAPRGPRPQPPSSG